MAADMTKYNADLPPGAGGNPDGSEDSSDSEVDDAEADTEEDDDGEEADATDDVEHTSAPATDGAVEEDVVAPPPPPKQVVPRLCLVPCRTDYPWCASRRPLASRRRPRRR